MRRPRRRIAYLRAPPCAYHRTRTGSLVRVMRGTLVERAAFVFITGVMTTMSSVPPVAKPIAAILPAPGFYLASFYDEPQLISSGARYDKWGWTMASRTLPVGTLVRVSRPDNGKAVVVKVNDWGPALWTGRHMDLSYAAAIELGMREEGVVIVNVSRP